MRRIVGVAWGALALAASAAALAPPEQGRVLSFYGLPLQTSAVPIGLSSTYTFEGWVWVEGLHPTSQSMFLILTAGSDFLEVGVNPGSARLYGATPVRFVESPSGIQFRRWTHVAVRSSASAFALFVDGVKVAEGAASSTMLPQAVVTMGQDLQGSLRQLRVWREALSELDILHVAEELPNPGDPRLAAWWPLDDAAPGSGNLSTYVVADRGPNGIDILNWEPPGRARWVRPSVLEAGPFFATHHFAPQYPVPRWIDFDHDGDLDVYMLEHHGAEDRSLGPPWYTGPPPRPDRAFRNDGGQFTDVSEAVLVGPRIQGYLVHDHYVADFTGDDLPDIMVTEAGPELGDPAEGDWGWPNSIRVGTPSGQLINESEERIEQMPDYDHRSAVGDIDGDGSLDVVSAGAGLQYLGGFYPFYFNDGKGFFRTVIDPVPAALLKGLGYRSTAVALVDADLDGDLDLLLGEIGAYAYNRLLLNDGSGSFSLAPIAWLPPKHHFAGECDSGPCRQANTILAPSDFDGNGIQDLIISSYDIFQPGEQVQRPHLQLLLGNGDGTFRDGTPRVPPVWQFGAPFLDPGTSQIGAFAAFDQNGDNWPDLAVGDLTSIPATILINRGTAGFEEAGDIIGSGAPLHFVDAGDMDADGDPDLVWSGRVLQNLKPYAPNGFPAANLGLRQSMAQGATLVQTVVVENAGGADAPNVVLAISVPHGYRRQATKSGAGACGVDKHVVLCERPALEAGGTWQVEVTSKAEKKPKLVGTHAVASVTADVLDPDRTDNFARVRLEPPGPWLTTGEIKGFAFKVQFTSDGKATAGKVAPSCLKETFCAGTSLNRADVLVRVLGPKPSGGFRPTGLRFTAAQVEVWVRQIATGEVRYYLMPATGSTSIPGFLEREGLAPASPAPTALEADPVPPAGAWLTTTSVPGFRFKVRIKGPQKSFAGKKVTACIAETLCVSGAVATRAEEFVRVSGPQANGNLWPAVVKFNPAQVELWVEQVKSGSVRYYLLPAVPNTSEELPGILDRAGFKP